MLIITTYYYSVLHHLMLHGYYCLMLIKLLLNCYVSSPYCCKTRVKMLVFDRLGLPPYPCIAQLSPLYSLPFHFDTNAYLLRMPGRKSREYVRYSPACFPPLFCIYLGCCPQSLEPRSRSRSSPSARSTTSRPPRTRSSSEVPRQEACALRS